MLDRRHVNEKTSRQGDVRRDARAFLRNRLFRNLDEYFLVFAQQVGDRRLVTLAARLSTITALIAFISLVALLSWTVFWFRSRRWRRCYDFFRLCNLYCLDIV